MRTTEQMSRTKNKNSIQKSESKTEKNVSKKSTEDEEPSRNGVPKRQQDPAIINLVKTARPRTKYKVFILSSTVFEVEQRYKVKEIIGHGAYGTVCSGFDLATKQPVAIKKIENIFAHKSLARRTLRELKLLRYFKHENIIKMNRVMRSNKNDSIYMVSELMETDLAMVIRSPQALSDEHCQFFLYQVLRGLKYIHSASVLHRDLKPRNLLVNSNCDLKICDFGLGRTLSSDDSIPMSNYIATRWYRAPEVILSRAEYTQAVDMWAVGCILAELLIRRPLFPGRDSFHQISLIISILGTPDEENSNLQYSVSNISLSSRHNKSRKSRRRKSRGFMSALPRKPTIPWRQVIPNASDLALDLLGKLLVFEQEDRLTVEQALQHPYLKELHYPDDEPNCDTLDIQDFYFENFKATREDMRLLMRQEVLCHYPEDKFRLLDEPTVQFFKPTGTIARRKTI